MLNMIFNRDKLEKEISEDFILKKKKEDKILNLNKESFSAFLKSTEARLLEEQEQKKKDANAKAEELLENENKKFQKELNEVNTEIVNIITPIKKILK